MSSHKADVLESAINIIGAIKNLSVRDGRFNFDDKFCEGFDRALIAAIESLELAVRLAAAASSVPEDSERETSD